MQEIPSTFCPAKWDEIYISFESQYAYACCKSRPQKFKHSVWEIIDQQKENLLNSVQDESCNYCWTVENAGGKSLRHRYLEHFNKEEFDQYQNNTTTPKVVQVNVGNQCNFQCTYCNPKFSSQWENDVTQQPYRLFTDRFFYQTETKHKNVMQSNVEFLQSLPIVSSLSIIGGEPLLNKHFFELVNSVSADNLRFATNLSCNRQTIDRVIELSKKYKSVEIDISIDATGEVAEFIRYGLDFNLFNSNLDYLLDHKPNNVIVRINSVVGSLSISDIKNFSAYVLSKSIDQWYLVTCQEPRMQSFATLPDTFKQQYIDLLEQLKQYSHIYYIDAVQTNIRNSVFSATMHKELQNFLNEFSTRKGITIPKWHSV